MNYNIQTININKTYDSFCLKNININVPEGKIVGLVGENGSGKSTTIKAILDLVKIDSGSIKIFGNDSSKLNKMEKEKIGVVLDDSFFPPQLMVSDINKIMKKIYINWNTSQFFEYIKKFNVPDKKIIKELSSGMKMKLKIIIALSHNPNLLILDEPTNGLDPIIRYEILEMFSDFVSNKKNSILISSHITNDLEHIATDLVFISNGEIVLELPKNDIKLNYRILHIPTEDSSVKVGKDEYIKVLKVHDEFYYLINNSNSIKEKYNIYRITKPSLDDFMLLIIRGEY